MNAHDPHVLTGIDTSTLQRQRRIRGPTRSSSAALHEETRHHQDRSGNQQPEAKGVHLREGHVAGTDHQGDDVIREPDKPRNNGEENHHRGVHRHHLIIKITILTEEIERQFNSGEMRRLDRFDDRAWGGQLDANSPSKETTDDTHGDGEPKIHQADFFMIDGREPIHQAGVALERNGWHDGGSGHGWAPAVFSTAASDSLSGLR